MSEYKGMQRDVLVYEAGERDGYAKGFEDAKRRAAEVADEEAEMATEDMAESKEWPNSYGHGFDSGQRQAAIAIAETIRALKPEAQNDG